MSEHMKVKKVVGNCQHGFTRGKVYLALWTAFSDGFTVCMDKGRANSVVIHSTLTERVVRYEVG